MKSRVNSSRFDGTIQVLLHLCPQSLRHTTEDPPNQTRRSVRSDSTGPANNALDNLLSIQGSRGKKTALEDFKNVLREDNVCHDKQTEEMEIRNEDRVTDPDENVDSKSGRGKHKVSNRGKK